MPKNFDRCVKQKGSRIRTIHPSKSNPKAYMHVCWRSKQIRKGRRSSKGKSKSVHGEIKYKA